MSVTEYHPSYAARARDLCMLGCNEVEIAAVLGISVGFLRAWREHYEDFNQAWMDGTYHASTKVLAALFKRAIGYEVTTWKETQNGMMRELKHIEPSVPACVFWLVNKHPDQWKSKIEHEVGAGVIIPVDTMTEIETARRVAFALTKAVHDSRSIEHGESDVQGKTK